MNGKAMHAGKLKNGNALGVFSDLIRFLIWAYRLLRPAGALSAVVNKKGGKVIAFPGPKRDRWFKTRKGQVAIGATICALIVGLDQALPVVFKWASAFRGGAETVLTLTASDRIDHLDTEAVTLTGRVEALEANQGTLLDAVGDLKTSSRVQQEMLYQLWAEQRAMRGLPAPPRPAGMPGHRRTPTPVPTETPDPELEWDEDGP